MTRRTGPARGRSPPGEGLLPRLDGRAGPARRLPSSAAAELIRSAIDEALESPEELDAELIEPLEPPRRTGRVLAFAAAALIGISVGGGAAALVSRILDGRLPRSEPKPARAVRPPARSTTRLPAPPPPPAPVEVAIPPALFNPAPEPARPVPPPRPVAQARPRVVVPENAPPEDLLALANEQRRLRNWPDADLLYRTVISRFPSTDAAVVSEISSATLHLQQLADPTGALASYRLALKARSSGPLAEEARWGVAEAQRSLGDAQAEAEALGQFLELHPRSALAETARRRLAELKRP